MENYRARAILLLVIFIFPALVECKVRLYDFRVSAHSLLRSYGTSSNGQGLPLPFLIIKKEKIMLNVVSVTKIKH